MFETIYRGKLGSCICTEWDFCKTRCIVCLRVSPLGLYFLKNLNISLKNLIRDTMSETVKIGKRYTVVIPKAFRTKLGLKEGQLSEVRLEDGKIVITLKSSDPFRRLSELIGDLVYDQETEKRAEKWLVEGIESRRA